MKEVFKAKQNRRRESESLWNITLLMSKPSEIMLPSEKFRCKFVFHFVMLIFKKFMIVGDTFCNSKPLSNHECGTDDDQL